jgi:hypothetical protein
MDITWDDQMGSRQRRAHLWLVRPATDEGWAFAGAHIPGVVAVVGSDYTKSGKWSHSTYRLRLGPGVEARPWKEGWETGTLAEAVQADTWEAFASWIGLSRPAAEAFLRSVRPRAADHWDEVEKQLDLVEDSEGDPSVLTWVSPHRLSRRGWSEVAASGGVTIRLWGPEGVHESISYRLGPDGYIDWSTPETSRPGLLIERRGGGDLGSYLVALPGPLSASAGPWEGGEKE